MSVRGRHFATPHAVRRCMDRVGFKSYESARDWLVSHADEAHYVRPERNGAGLWRGPAPHRLRLIIGQGSGPLPAIITVLASHDGAA